MFSSVTQSCPTLFDPMNCSTPGLSIHHQLPEFTQTHVHRVSDAIQASPPLSSPSPPAPNPSQHQSFPVSQLFASGGQSTGVSALASFLMYPQTNYHNFARVKKKSKSQGTRNKESIVSQSIKCLAQQSLETITRVALVQID